MSSKTIEIKLESKMTNQEFVKLAGDMIMYNDQLTRNFDDWKLDRSTCKMLIMGPTKSGKSTFLSRLSVDLEPEEFLELVKKINVSTEAKAEIGGIRIGAAMGSTTLVPNYRRINRQDVIDLAGFLDTNKDKAPLITILNYRLFSKLKDSVLLVVLNLNELSDDSTFNNCMSHYVTEFTNLFTENNFDRCLNSSYFILTRVDDYAEKHNLNDMVAVRARVREDLSRQAMKMESPKSAAILRRMFRHMMVADYSKVNGEDMFNQLNELISDLVVLNCGDLVFDSVSSTNDLCSKALEIMMAFNVALEDYKDQHKKMKEKISNEIKKHNSETINYENVQRDTQNYINKMKQDMSNNDLKMKILTETLNKLPDQIAEQKQDIENVVQQFDRSRKTLSSMTMLEIITIKSIEHKRYLQKIERCQANIERSKGAVRPPICYFMTQPSYHDFKSKIDSCTTLEDIDELKLPRVTNLGSDHKMETRSDSIYINISYDNPFVVLIMSEINIAKNGNLNLILDYFRETISKMETELKQKEEALKEGSISMILMKEENAKLASDIHDHTDKHNRSKEDQQLSLAQHKSFLETKHKEATSLLEEIEKMVNGDLFKLTGKLSSILTEANVDVSKFGVFDLIKSELDLLIKSVKDTMSWILKS